MFALWLFNFDIRAVPGEGGTKGNYQSERGENTTLKGGVFVPTRPHILVASDMQSSGKQKKTTMQTGKNSPLVFQLKKSFALSQLLINNMHIHILPVCVVGCFGLLFANCMGNFTQALWLMPALGGAPPLPLRTEVPSPSRWQCQVSGSLNTTFFCLLT